MEKGSTNIQIRTDKGKIIFETMKFFNSYEASMQKN